MNNRAVRDRAGSRNLNERSAKGKAERPRIGLLELDDPPVGHLHPIDVTVGRYSNNTKREGAPFEEAPYLLSCTQVAEPDHFPRSISDLDLGALSDIAVSAKPVADPIVGPPTTL